MDYSQLSDFEINKRVAVELGKDWSVEPVQKIIHVHSGEGNLYVPYSPCNNPADAWPIIVDNGINILWDWNENGLHGASANPIWEYEHENVLRAAMIVFLMMQDAKHA